VTVCRTTRSCFVHSHNSAPRRSLHHVSLIVALFSAGARVAFPPRTLLQHILFINTLKEAAELEQLRHARTKMSEVYPLTPGEASPQHAPRGHASTTPKQHFGHPFSPSALRTRATLQSHSYRSLLWRVSFLDRHPVCTGWSARVRVNMFFVMPHIATNIT
jgi:hypothetical protein